MRHAQACLRRGLCLRRNPVHSSVVPLPVLLAGQRRVQNACSVEDSAARAAAAGAATDPQPPAAKSARRRKDVAVVLVEPQIPQNAGNAARTCAATCVPMHVVKPLGFELDSNKLKRAGLDYWPYVCVNVHDSWAAFLTAFDSWPGPKRLVAYSKFAKQHYAVDGTYTAGDVLLFGAETHGLPDGAVADIQGRGGLIVKIPMDETYVRSLNLATSVGIGLYEVLRQLDKPQAGDEVAKQVDC